MPKKRPVDVTPDADDAPMTAAVAALYARLGTADRASAIAMVLGSHEGFDLFQVKVPRDVSPPQVTRRTGVRAIKVAPDAPAAYDVIPKLENAIGALGNNTVADLLAVSRSQPGRWVRGEEGISQENEAAILDLDFVLSLLLRAMPADLAGVWLVSPNAHLNGGRPVDALRIEGHRRVVEAIQAYAEGAYA